MRAGFVEEGNQRDVVVGDPAALGGGNLRGRQGGRMDGKEEGKKKEKKRE